MIKAACDPDVALGKENISRWLDGSEHGGEKHASSWFIAGHTRLATRGKVNRQNSHPFRYGKIIGCHNGMVDAPKGYAVDSQYLFDSLNKANGDYNKAWAGVSGYWAVAWFDDDAFYLQVHNGEVSIALASDDCWYYSSSKVHLAACIGHTATMQTLTAGQTYRFTLKDGVVTMSGAAAMVSSAPAYWSHKYSSAAEWLQSGYEGYQQRHGRTSKNTYYEDEDKHGTPGPVKDYDKDWRDAWEAYSTSSEHSRVD